MMMLLFGGEVDFQRFVANGRNRGAGDGPDALELVPLAALADGVVLVAFFLSFPARQAPSFGPDQRFGSAGFRFGARWRAHGETDCVCRSRLCLSLIFPRFFPNLSNLLRIDASRPRRCRPPDLACRGDTQ